jgi:hypothetical protein
MRAGAVQHDSQGRKRVIRVPMTALMASSAEVYRGWKRCADVRAKDGVGAA